MKQSMVKKEKNSFDSYSMNNIFIEKGEIYRGINNKEIYLMYKNGLIDELMSRNILTPSNIINNHNKNYLAIISQPELLPRLRLDVIWG